MVTVTATPLVDEPVPLAARRATEAVAVDETLYLFGGVGAAGTESVLDVNDHLWQFDTGTLSWSRVPSSDPWPSPRRCQGWDAVNGTIFCWGGSSLREPDSDEADPNAGIIAPGDVDVTYDFRNDLWTFDVATERWRRLERTDDYRSNEYGDQDRPRPRYTAVFHTIGDRMLLFSGKTQTEAYENVHLNDTWFREADGQWRRVRNDECRPGVDSEADWPARRYGAMSAASDEATFVFGGYGDRDLNDLWRFDHDAESWTLLSPHRESADWPAPRYGSSFVLYDDLLYLFGGRSREHPKRNYNDLWTFDVSERTWTQHQENRAPHRYDETAEYPGYHAKSANAVVGTDWYVWGGEGRQGHVSDFWRFDLAAHEWQLVQPQRDDDPDFW